MKKKILYTNIAILGGGPSGYTSAFRLSDLGKKVILIEKYNKIGGICLHVGCIPSKAMLNISKIIYKTNILFNFGLKFNNFIINIKKIFIWKKRKCKKGNCQYCNDMMNDVFNCWSNNQLSHPPTLNRQVSLAPS